jgi:hypothetical protein
VNRERTLRWIIHWNCFVNNFPLKCPRPES